MSQVFFISSGHLVRVNGLNVAGAQFGGGLGGFAFAVPVTGSESGKKKDGHIRNRQGRPAKRLLNPEKQPSPQGRGVGGFGASDPVPNRLLEARGQLGLRLPGLEKLAQ